MSIFCCFLNILTYGCSETQAVEPNFLEKQGVFMGIYNSTPTPIKGSWWLMIFRTSAPSGWEAKLHLLFEALQILPRQLPDAAGTECGFLNAALRYLHIPQGSASQAPDVIGSVPGISPACDMMLRGGVIRLGRSDRDHISAGLVGPR